MLKRKNMSYFESFWAASSIAFMMHGIAIAAIFWGTRSLPIANTLDTFCVNIVFGSEVINNTSEKPVKETSVLPNASQRTTKSQKIVKTQTKSISQFTQISQPHLDSTNDFEKRALSSPSPHPQKNAVCEEGQDIVPIFNPYPEYPLEAKRRHLQGVVLVRACVTDAGTVDKAMALCPHIDPVLEDAALKAVYKWRFKGKARTIEIPIEFKLET